MESNDGDKISTDQYGRKKWNIKIYEQEAKRKPKKEDNLDSKYLLSNDSSNGYLNHRNRLLNETLNKVKKYNLINPELSLSNKRFGFYCPICELTFKDNLKLIDHLNSPQHVQKSTQLNKKDGDDTDLLDGGIRRASLNEVIRTIEKLIAKNIKEKENGELGNSEGLSFHERVQRRVEFENNKRQKRQEKRQLNKLKKKKLDAVDGGDDVHEMMGFKSFGSTKK
ncbi:unnamed protein product [Candida verbasci]|uniref:C2H2-type domain-containing protein n=1 Tax=Candida verbasci TaxID=1227364 RepID=A0A9W4X8U4_9ASCO|nr:unnamed protein product [Candida verbasci]